MCMIDSQTCEYFDSKFYAEIHQQYVPPQHNQLNVSAEFVHDLNVPQLFVTAISNACELDNNKRCMCCNVRKRSALSPPPFKMKPSWHPTFPASAKSPIHDRIGLAGHLVAM